MINLIIQKVDCLSLREKKALRKQKDRENIPSSDLQKEEVISMYMHIKVLWNTSSETS